MHRKIEIKLFYILPFVLPFLVCNCEFQEVDNNTIAQVGSFKLTQDDILDLGSDIHKDSLQTKIYVDKWVKQKSLFLASERNLNNKVDIEELVQDYKQSLMVHQYEQEYLVANLSEVVSEEEINGYYEQNFKTVDSGDTYLKVLLAKIPADHPGLSNFKEWWKNDNIKELQRFCTDHDQLCLLNTDNWHLKKDIELLLPKAIRKALKKGKNLIQKSEKAEYFVKTIDIKTENESVPFEKSKENIIERILFTRKKQLLIHLRDSIYQKAIETNKIKIKL